jgi:hypothetical protein
LSTVLIELPVGAERDGRDKQLKDSQSVHSGSPVLERNKALGTRGKERPKSIGVPPTSSFEIEKEDTGSSNPSKPSSAIARFLKGWSSPSSSTISLDKTGVSKSNGIFGGSLLVLAARAVPDIVIQCTSYIEEKGSHIEGIYRLSGNVTSIQKLKSAYVNGTSPTVSYGPSNLGAKPMESPTPIPSTPDVRQFDINTVASTLKLFFRELQDPLLLYELYTEWTIAGKLRGSARVDKIRTLLSRLPASHLLTLGYLMHHLQRMSAFSEVTKMDATNFAIVFGPTLIKPKVESLDSAMHMEAHNSVVEEMITHCDDFFGDLPV